LNQILPTRSRTLTLSIVLSKSVQVTKQNIKLDFEAPTAYRYPIHS